MQSKVHNGSNITIYFGEQDQELKRHFELLVRKNFTSKSGWVKQQIAKTMD